MPPISGLLVDYRRPVVLALHLLLWTISYATAFLLRFDFSVPEHWLSPLYGMILLPILVARSVMYARFGLFQGMWKYTGQRDLESLLIATGLSSAIYAIPLLLSGISFPRSVLLIEPMVALALGAGLRFTVRTVAQAATRFAAESRRRLVLVGAGGHRRGLAPTDRPHHARRGAHRDLGR